jgi:hypothetical protein
MKKWNRKLGTSKREQGIVTPKQPKKKIAPIKLQSSSKKEIPIVGWLLNKIKPNKPATKPKKWTPQKTN